MSRNFELLSRLTGAEALFPPVAGDGPLESPRARWEGNELGAELTVVEKTVAPSPEPPFGKQEREELVKLVRRVFALPNGRTPRAVTFSSVEGGGTSGLSFYTGAMLASQASVSVCLVDANLHCAALCLLCGVANSPGLAEAMTQSRPITDFAVRMAGTNLWVVPPGSSANGAPSAFPSDRLRSRITELRGLFDYVLIDAPAASCAGDALLLGQMAEGVILVIEAHSTRRETARTVKHALELANVRLLGAILNNRTFPIPEALYRKL